MNAENTECSVKSEKKYGICRILTLSKTVVHLNR